MKYLFLTYEQSLKLKELGFNEPCFFAFDNSSIPMRCSDLKTSEQKFNGVNYNSSSYTSQPLKSQVFKWFRNKHNIISEIRNWSGSKDQWYYMIHLSNSELIQWQWKENKTYEEAEDDCIDKLIELIK